MKLPSMKYSDGIGKSQQVRFGGLNHNRGANDGELWDMQNLTSDHYPLLASRAPRLKYRCLTEPGGIYTWDGLCWVDGPDFYFQGTKKGTVAKGEKSFASMGAYILIFPDKCYYNVDTGTFGSLESRWEGKNLTFGDGLLYGESASANCISCSGIDWEKWFKAGDAVTIDGCTVNPGNNISIIIRDIDGDKLYFYENSFALSNGKTYTENGTLTIKRSVPDLKFVCENENRLWGCTDATIYASKLGDVFNWNVYDGLDTDSFTVDTGSAGQFTGCISYRGYPTFFKEDHIYKVYGSVPSDFEVMGSATLGLAEGSGKSLAVAGESLFYLSRNGIMAYTGGIPQPMGAVFGLKRFKNAVAGSDGLKYYASMEDEKGESGLWVYDTQKGMWHKEDNTQAMHFTRHDGNLYMLTQDGDVWIIGNVQDPPEGTEVEGEIEWFAEFADFSDENPNRKGVSKLQLRLELEAGAQATIWMMFDSEGMWQKISSLGSETKRSYYLPIVPRRADHYRLKITGKNKCRIYSLTREFYAGSEIG